MEAILVKNDLWCYPNGSKLKLSSDAVAWESKDAKAEADLVLSMSPSELSRIRGCVTSRDVWLKIESRISQKDQHERQHFLKR